MMKRVNESERLNALTVTEREFWDKGLLAAGMDEVGRGPLAGPVVAACVVLPSEPLIEHVNDSKKVSEKRREELYPIIKDTAIACATAFVDHDVIDSINILNATKLAFKDAYYSMKYECSDVLIDAVKGLDIPANQHPMIHGDALSYLIGAASIVAKVERDRYMCQMHELYPQYNFLKNKGYGTSEHIKAIREYGPCPIHRLTFIKNFI